MKVAIVKPDWRISGGFEKVVDQVAADLVDAGHDVGRIDVDVPSIARQPFGVPVPDEAWARAPEWFNHFAMLEKFRDLDLSDADLVISTQPPSYAVRHPRQLALFYHHQRAFYDLAEVWVASGLAPAALHDRAVRMLRAAEAPDLAGVSHFLAGSPRVAERLRHYQGPEVPVSLYDAAAPQIDLGGESFDQVLCVSRHEFTKRTELVVQALALGSAKGVLVGGGGRLPFVAALASAMAAGTVDPGALTDEDLWLNLGLGVTGLGEGHPRIRLPGRVDDVRLDREYRSALCVVAPAYDEDDGLTVREAFAHGKPVIVCRDGGGLTSSVQDGVNGFVVEPTGAAIAEAVAALADDRELARQMGAAGRETALERTPGRARDQLLAAVELVGSRGR